MKSHLAAFTAGAILPSMVVLARLPATPSPTVIKAEPPLVVLQAQGSSSPQLMTWNPDHLDHGFVEAEASDRSRSSSNATTLAPAPAHMAANLDAGVSLMNQALSKTPAAVATMGQAVTEHGIAAFVYDVPEVKEQTNLLGHLIGASLRHFAEALRDDMVKTARESGIARKPESVSRLP